MQEKQRSGLAKRIKALILKGQGDRDEILADLWAYQTTYGESLNQYAQALGAPTEVALLPNDVVPVHTLTFRDGDLICYDPDKYETRVEFRSSGTTGQRPSIHRLRTLELYDTAILNGFKKAVPEVSRGSHTLISLLPSREAWPHSSLVHMFDLLMEHYSPTGAFHVGTTVGVPSIAELVKRLAVAQQKDKPVLLLGTTLSHLYAVDNDGNHDLTLPPGSLILETGGTKNAPSQEPDGARLQKFLQTYGIPAEQVVIEYGMAELGSQAYGRQDTEGTNTNARPTLQFPAWVACSALDPDTLRPVGKGELGVLQIFDPVNLDTCAFVLTSDLVRNHGDNAFSLVGRVREADARGCSLAVPTTDASLQNTPRESGGQIWRPDEADLDSAPPGSRITALAKTWKSLSNLSTSTTRASCQRLADTMGISMTQVLEGLRRESLRWTGDRLAEILARETSPFATARIRIRPVDGVVLIPASTVPFVGLESLTIALLAGCNVALKPSRRTEEEVTMFLAALKTHAPDLADKVHLVDPQDDHGLTQALSRAEAVVVHGDRTVINRVRSEAQPTARVHAFGPRWSMVFLDATDAKSSELMAGLATDILLYDSLGCLTPRLVLVPGEQREARWVADSLGNALDAAARRFEPHPDVAQRPVGAGPVSQVIQNLRRDPRGLESLRQFGTARLLLLGPPTNKAPGIKESIPPFRRGVVVAALNSGAPTKTWLGPGHDRLSTVGISAGILKSDLHEVVEEFAIRHGAARVTTPGRLQTPPAGWPHDGSPLFLPFVRLITPG